VRAAPPPGRGAGAFVAEALSAARAAGILMVQHRVGAAEALARLRADAFARGLTVTDLARRIVADDLLSDLDTFAKPVDVVDGLAARVAHVLVETPCSVILQSDLTGGGRPATGGGLAAAGCGRGQRGTRRGRRLAIQPGQRPSGVGRRVDGRVGSSSSAAVGVPGQRCGPPPRQREFTVAGIESVAPAG
jgi:hypothetical protein